MFRALLAGLLSGCARGPALSAGGGPDAVGAVVTEAEAPPERPLLTLPLAVGDRWTWVEERREGGGLVLWVLPAAPIRRERVGTRVLEIVDHDPTTDRYTARVTREVPGEPSRSETFTVWNDAAGTWMLDGSGAPVPAVVGTAVPEPLEGEVLPCDFALLRVRGGRCSAMSDGPLHAPPGLLGVQLQGKGGFAQLGSMLLGVMTAGLMVPSVAGPSLVLELESYAPADGRPVSVQPTSPFLREVEAAGPFVRPAQLSAMVRRHQPGPEALALALVRMSRGDTVAGALPILLDAAAPGDRHRVLRVALQRPFPHEQLLLVCLSLPLLPDDLSAPKKAALTRAAGSNAQLVEQLLSGPHPFVVDWLVAGSGRPDPELLETVLARHAPPPEELRLAIGLLTFDRQRLAALRTVLPRLPEAGRAEWVLQLSDGMRTDDGTLDAMAVGLPVLAPAERLDAFCAWYGRLQWDEARLASVTRWSALVAEASPEQRAALYAQARFPDAALATALGVPPGL